MNCKTCKHWQPHPDEFCQIVFPYHPGTGEPCETEEEVRAVFGYIVRRCRHPKIVFYQRPEQNAAAVIDGSEYSASLLTAEDFGCVLHEGGGGDGK